MFPWQSGATGREESQTLHLNPRSGRWLPDNSPLQRHIGLAVAYNTWRYYEATGDVDFLAQYGAELILDVATVLGRPRDLRPDPTTATTSAASWAPTSTTTRSPDGTSPGLDDNAYTNVHGRLDARPGPRLPARCCPPRRRHELLDLARHPPARPGAVGARQPQAAAVLARRRHPQPVPRLRRARGVRLGRLPRALRRHQPARPHPRGRGRHDQPLQAVQAGRRPHALPAAHRRRAVRRPRPARLPRTTRR